MKGMNRVDKEVLLFLLHNTRTREYLVCFLVGRCKIQEIGLDGHLAFPVELSLCSCF